MSPDEARAKIEENAARRAFPVRDSARSEVGPESAPTRDLLDDVEAFVARYVAYPSVHALVAVVLWIAHAHLVDRFDSTPRLAFLSPEPGSGKSRSLEVMELLVPRPMSVLSASAAAIFRTIEAQNPTLLFDEVDTLFGRRGTDDSNEDLRALLNAGHRNGAQIPRCVGPQHQVVMFPVFAPVALAGLGDLPDTLMSRSVVIRMRRRAPHEVVEPFRIRFAEPPGHALRDQLAAWARDVRDVGDAFPEMPEGVTDRAADVWEPLLAIADAMGGNWPVRAREACLALVHANVNREASLGVRLLGDLRTIFGTDDYVFTEVALERLCKLEESPWGDLRGKPLDARGLARRLNAYGISSKTVRIGEATAKGYSRTDLHDAWVRYLPTPEGASPASQPSPVTPVTDVTHPQGTEGVSAIDDIEALYPEEFG